MRNKRTFQIIGRGVYSFSEASRLSKVPAARIRRWTRGYVYTYRGEERFSPPPLGVSRPADKPIVSFSDLLEVRFLNVFREHGVSWRSIRIASERAKELLGRQHPFSSRIFKTDGRTILAEIVRETGDRFLLDLVHSQYEFEKIVSPFLYAGVEYNDLLEPERWWPLGLDRQVVVDPERALGAPVVWSEGIPTRVLYHAYTAEQSYSFVAKWFEVSEESVKDAVAFELTLTA
jgi:uncharacterized protein (DUF433 family)